MKTDGRRGRPAGRLRGSDGVRLTGRAEPASLDGQLAAAALLPLIVVVNDAHRRAWRRDLASLTAAADLLTGQSSAERSLRGFGA